MPFDQSTSRPAAVDLMSSPHPMLAWLRSKRSDDIVAEDMMDCRRCLGATFLRENGHGDAKWVADVGVVDLQVVPGCKAIEDAIFSLLGSNDDYHITAARALEALETAICSEGASS
jgi:hypothetical protein